MGYGRCSCLCRCCFLLFNWRIRSGVRLTVTALAVMVAVAVAVLMVPPVAILAKSAKMILGRPVARMTLREQQAVARASPRQLNQQWSLALKVLLHLL